MIIFELDIITFAIYVSDGFSIFINNHPRTKLIFLGIFLNISPIFIDHEYIHGLFLEIYHLKKEQQNKRKTVHKQTFSMLSGTVVLENQNLITYLCS